MAIWPKLTEEQVFNQNVAQEVLGRGYPETWEEVENIVREAFVKRAEIRGTDQAAARGFANMILEEEIHLIWPIIRRFFTQR